METTETPDDIGGVDADDFTVGETGFEDVGSFVVGEAAVGGEDDFVVGDVEIGIAGREPLVVVEDHIRHGKLHDSGLLTIGKAATIESLEVLLQHIEVFVPTVVFYCGDNSVRRDEATEVINVAVGVVAHDSVAQPNDIINTVIVFKILFYLTLIQEGVSVWVEEAGGSGEEVTTAVHIDAAALHDDARLEEFEVGVGL